MIEPSQSEPAGSFKPPFRQRPVAKPPVTLRFDVQPDHLPALKSAIEEISNMVGTRLEGPRKFSEETALTFAAAALGSLRTAIFRSCTIGSPDYVW